MSWWEICSKIDNNHFSIFFLNLNLENVTLELQFSLLLIGIYFGQLFVSLVIIYVIDNYCQLSSLSHIFRFIFLSFCVQFDPFRDFSGVFFFLSRIINGNWWDNMETVNKVLTILSGRTLKNSSSSYPFITLHNYHHWIIT